MQVRLRALVPSLALAVLAGSALGIYAGMRFHVPLAGALPPHLVVALHLDAPALLNPEPLASTAPATMAADDDVVIYQCGMHNPPYERKTLGDGKCPLCGMPLQTVHIHRSQASQVTIDPVMVQNMGVRTAMPVLGKLQETVRAVGTLTEPEQNHREINLRVNGWIEKLYANQEGMSVNAGDPLFELASPDITTAGDELIRQRYKLDLAKSLLESQRSAAPEMRDALLKAAQTNVDLEEYNTFLARRKLLLMGLSEEQVAGMEKMDKAPATITITSPMHGHVAAKNIIEGSAVKSGDDLMRIADRSTMWMIVQVFEQQIGEVKIGETVTAHVEAAPGKVFTGKVDFVYPHLDPSTRTAQVRVLLDNHDHNLHENMFAQAEIQVDAGADDKPRVLVPREAVLDSGQRQVVFVDKGTGHFAMQEVKMGRTGVPANMAPENDTARYVEILTGLTEDDKVVTSGQFLLDSESRLEEARRKFASPAADQAMPGMDMSGGAK